VSDEATKVELIVPLDSRGEAFARGVTSTYCVAWTVTTLSSGRNFTALFQTKTDFDRFQAQEFRGSYLVRWATASGLEGVCTHALSS
jgi:hypothetical protein